MTNLTNMSDFFYNFIDNENMKNNGFFRDLHIHTPMSDGKITVDELKNFIMDKKHLIAVTDHNHIGSSIALAEMGIKNVPGMELGCEDGFELLTYFKTHDDLEEFYIKEVEQYKNIRRMAKTHRDVHTYLNILKDYDCHISIPHIAGFAQKNFLMNKEYIIDVIEAVDSIEIHNNSLNNERNNRAKKIALDYNKTITFGSDAHLLCEVKAFYNLLNNTPSLSEKVFNYLSKVSTLSYIAEQHLVHLIKSYKSTI